jgi:hypothetical protein
MNPEIVVKADTSVSPRAPAPVQYGRQFNVLVNVGAVTPCPIAPTGVVAVTGPDGVASVPYLATTRGARTLMASYPGSPYYNASTSTVNVQVN